VSDLLRYYRSRKDLAFSTVPKTMDLMEGQYYATAFREKYPKFNGLIWAYHWLQVGLYEPLIRGSNSAERQTGVVAAVARFWQMLESPPDGMPVIMPMTAAISPAFAERYPDAAIIFDNLHSMHDVISDILASPRVPRNRKRAEILLAAARYRDDTSFVMTRAEWLSMSSAMGVNNMGGPAMNFLLELPAPTVARGAVHAGDHSAHAAAPTPAAPAHVHGDSAATPPPAAHAHGDTSATATPMAGMDHGAMHAQAESTDEMMAVMMRMLRDATIRQRILASPEMRRMMNELIDSMPADHQAEMRKLMTPPKAAPKPASAKKPPAKDPHEGMVH
jgi:hypothetical protein